jgi:glycine/D-amino acid oxidase-like deaminating enzyme
LHWYRCTDNRYQQEHGCPTFLYDLPDGCFYGFPSIDSLGVKVAEHSGGTEIKDPTGDARLREPEENRRVEAFVTKHLPGITREETLHAVCFYTMSPDHHFIVDQHPSHSQVTLAAGLSGHGFKFTAVLGQMLADLTLAGATPLPAQFLGLRRFI